jgi:hypothetical protein
MDDMILFSEKQKVKRLEKRTVPRRQGAPSFGSKHDQYLVQKQLEVSKALDIHDPIFHEQWHLLNTVEKGHDVNVTGVWLEGITGFNSTVAIVDDGLDMYSEDLKANYVSGFFGHNLYKVDFYSLQRVLMILTTKIRSLSLDCQMTDMEPDVPERLLR